MARRQHRFYTVLTFVACTAVGVCRSNAGAALVAQPDGLLVPIDEDLSSDYFESSYKRFRAETLGLQAMLNTWEGVETDSSTSTNASAARPRIDAYSDARVSSGLFSPLCGMQSSLILRGSACQMELGWYCADDPSGQETIHTLVSAADILNYYDNVLATLPGKPPPPPDSWEGYQNDEKGYVPTIQAGYETAVVSTAQLGDLRSSADYQLCKSGKIGFALRGSATSICPMTKFSESSRNQISDYGGVPWINAVVYPSKKSAGTLYVAFEDMPTSPASFQPTLGSLQSTYPSMTSDRSGWQDRRNDGDMNDFVFRIEGVACEGGGRACSPYKDDGVTLWKGACSLGVTACSATPNVPGVCLQRVKPTTETCNGWDDDCDGVADNGNALCPTNYVCDHGKCVGACNQPGFECSDPNYVCQTTGQLAGYCVEKSCLDINCPAGARCEAGACIGNCERLACATGMECIAGSCVDLCAGVECPTNFVCEGGVCIPDCKCLPCTDAKKSRCNTDGHCVNDPCKDVVCEAYKTCVAGACVDPCSSQTCKAGAQCSATAAGTAVCSPPVANGAGGMPGSVAVPVTSEPVAGANASRGGPSESTGCSCRLAARDDRRGFAILAILGLAGVAVRRSRRAR
jgi:hypothetical protein